MTNQTERDGKSLFTAMNTGAWIALAVGIVLCLMNIGDFSDNNATLMAGIGCLVGSVFIYTIGTAMSLVHKRNEQPEATTK